jgi:hypothetical protein
MSTKVASVKKNAKAAEELHAQIYGAPKTDDAPQDTPPPAGAPQDTPPPVDPVAATPVAPIVDQNKKPEDWEHKYNTLRGMFNKEVPRLNATITELKLKVDNLEGLLASRSAQPAPLPQGRQLLNPDEINDYGEDMISVVKRAAREEIEPELSRLQQENNDLREQILRVQQTLGTVNAESVKTARERVFDSLSNAVPEWQTINVDPAFIEWLQQEDAFSGNTYQSMLDVAFERLDGPRVVAFFEKFVRESSLARHTIDPRGDAAATPTIRMDTLVAPGKPQRSQSTQLMSENEGEIWTHAEIAAFYKDCARGMYKNNPEEKARIERRIHRAANEGRLK